MVLKTLEVFTLRFSELDLAGLKKAYKEAIYLGLDEDFIKMLKSEIDSREKRTRMKENMSQDSKKAMS